MVLHIYKWQRNANFRFHMASRRCVCTSKVQSTETIKLIIYLHYFVIAACWFRSHYIYASLRLGEQHKLNYTMNVCMMNCRNLSYRRVQISKAFRSIVLEYGAKEKLRGFEFILDFYFCFRFISFFCTVQSVYVHYFIQYYVHIAYLSTYGILLARHKCYDFAFVFHFSSSFLYKIQLIGLNVVCLPFPIFTSFFLFLQYFFETFIQLLFYFIFKIYKFFASRGKNPVVERIFRNSFH